MAARAGLKPWEVDDHSPSDVWIVIEGHNQREQGEWERTRALAHNMAVFSGNMKTYVPPQQLWPFKWDRGGMKSNAETIMAANREKVERRQRMLREAGKDVI